jgi:hypothetical protein
MWNAMLGAAPCRAAPELPHFPNSPAALSDFSRHSKQKLGLAAAVLRLNLHECHVSTGA